MREENKGEEKLYQLLDRDSEMEERTTEEETIQSAFEITPLSDSTFYYLIPILLFHRSDLN